MWNERQEVVLFFCCVSSLLLLITMYKWRWWEWGKEVLHLDFRRREESRRNNSIKWIACLPAFPIAGRA